MIGDTRFHRWCASQGLVNPRKVVVHEVKGNRGLVIRELLRERIGQAREAAVAHADRKVLPLNMAGANPKTCFSRVFLIV